MSSKRYLGLGQDLFSTMTHVSGIPNILECKLHESTLKKVQRYFSFYPTMDLIKSTVRQMPNFLDF